MHDDRSKATHSAEFIEDLAHKAGAHARQIIRIGYTDMAANLLDLGEFTDLMNKIKALRSIYNPLLDRCYTTKNAEDVLKAVDKVIEVHTSKRIGNCGELALFALNYVLNHAPDVRAEVFHIRDYTEAIKYRQEQKLKEQQKTPEEKKAQEEKKSPAAEKDKVPTESKETAFYAAHVFLVFNRKVGSNPHDPKTWGENAYICDPWADPKEYRVFKASDYLAKRKDGMTYLRSFNFAKFSEGSSRYMNKIQPFDKSVHLLVDDGLLSTDILRPAIKEHFEQKFQSLRNTLAESLSPLIEMRNRLLSRKGKDNDKYKIVNRRYEETTKLIEDLDNILSKLRDKEAKPLCRNELNEIFQDVIQRMNALQLSKDEKRTLTKFGIFKGKTYKKILPVYEKVKKGMTGP